MEKAGVPTVTMGFSDQLNFFRNTSLINECPNSRWVTVPRVGTGEERVTQFYDQIIKALTDPLTAKEKESGLYSPPAPPRILFEGTYDEAQDFMQQTTLVENCRMCPVAKYTDGLPVIIPTEEAVAAMLTGTSHKPTENIAHPLARSATVTAGSIVSYALNYQTTVEKVAVCAVMAGCKPQYMPVALAIATAGGGTTSCAGTSGPFGWIFVVSGPIAKEIGMSAGQNAMDVGNPANVTLGRVGALMSVNFGGCITGLVRSDSGNPIHSVCFAEDTEGLPPGWEGYNEESTYYDATAKANVNFKKSESVLGKISTPGMWSIVQAKHSPGSLRELLSGNGGGGASRAYQALHNIPEGTPGIYNWLELYAPMIIDVNGNPGAHSFVMHPNMALGLYNFGFKTKAAAYKWLAETYFITERDYYLTGWWDHFTDSGKNIEPTSGKPYKDVPMDYKLAAFGTAAQNCFIVSAGFADEMCYIFGAGRPASYTIDPWR